jgi:signal transduction histidine kinase
MSSIKKFMAVGAITSLGLPTAALARDAEEIRALSEAKISLTQAIFAAEKHQGGQAYEAKVDDDSFKPEYEIDVAKDGRVYEVMENVASAFQPSAEERNQSILSSLAPGISISGDRSLLTQMFANLVENALRHTSDNAEIRLTLTRAKEEVIAGVADNGTGVPPEQYEHIFKPFYRLEQSRTSEGSGLGLSLVAAIAQAHGAALRLADNQPGLAVTIHFPIRT